MPHGARHFHVDFDFVKRALHVGDDTGARRSFALTPMSVAAFYRRVMYALDELGLAVDIWPVPVETETAVPFAENTEHASYNAEALQADVSQAGDVRQLFEETEERFGASKTAIIREAIRAYVADPTHVLPSSA